MNQQHIDDAVRDWNNAMKMAREIVNTMPEFQRGQSTYQERLDLANIMVIRNAILGVK